MNVSQSTHSALSQRDRDFKALCREIILKSPQPLTYREVLAKACAMAAPSYYVDYYYAMRKLRAIRKMPADKASRASRGRWAEIDSRVRKLEAEGMTHRKAVEQVLLTGNASGFFIAPSTALRHLRRIANR